MEKYLSAEEVAERLSLSRKTVLEFARKGTLPCIRIGKNVVRFSESALEKFLNEKPNEDMS